MAVPQSCAQALTAEDCALVPPVEAPSEACLWVPFVDFDDAACTQDVVGGACLEYSEGDTGCGGQAASCGADVYLATVDGGLRIARIADGCAYFLSGMGVDLLDCADVEGQTDPDPVTARDIAACECACAENYPD
jgi:hypothetical protein